MVNYSLIFGFILSVCLNVSARPQYQCTVPCPFTYPVNPGAGQTPTLNLVIRTESQKEDPSKSEACPPAPCPPPPCPSTPCAPCAPCAPYAPRRFCASVCALPGAIMDSILSGEVNL